MVIGFAIGRVGIVDCVVSIRVCLCRRHTSALQEPGSPDRLPSQNGGKKERKGRDGINAMPKQNGGRVGIAQANSLQKGKVQVWLARAACSIYKSGQE